MTKTLQFQLNNQPRNQKCRLPDVYLSLGMTDFNNTGFLPISQMLWINSVLFYLYRFCPMKEVMLQDTNRRLSSDLQSSRQTCTRLETEIAKEKSHRSELEQKMVEVRYYNSPPLQYLCPYLRNTIEDLLRCSFCDTISRGFDPQWTN